MYLNCRSLAALAAVGTCILGASAGPLDKRQTTTTTTSTSAQPTAALLVTTDSSGQLTTIEAALPSVLQGSATTTASDADATAATTTQTNAIVSSTGATSTLLPSKDFPSCTDDNAAPFCLPANNSEVWVGSTYYVTWNVAKFASNSTITVKISYDNESHIQAWSSDPIDLSWGVTTVKMDKSWLQGYDKYNLSIFALVNEGGNTEAVAYDGPMVTLQNKPASHYSPPPHTSMPSKESLLIGLPLGLGFGALVIFGLWFGMRKHRTIGLGNIMGRTNGYNSAKSKRQRLGLTSKKGAIRLEDRDLHNLPPEDLYRDQPEPLTHVPPRPFHTREESLGSLVSEDERSRGNAFRDEIERQRTGR